MNSLDIVIIVFLALALLIALIRGFKHSFTRIACDLFAFVLAFFLAIITDGALMVNNNTNYYNFISEMSAKFPDTRWLISMLSGAVFFLVYFLVFFILLRLLYRKIGSKKGLGILFFLLSYLSIALFLGFSTSYFFVNSANKNLQDAYLTSTIAIKLFPLDGKVPLMTYFVMIIGGI